MSSRITERMHLQWFGGEDPLPMTFEDGEEPDPDVVELPEGADLERLKGRATLVRTAASDEDDIPEEFKGKSRKELATMLKERPPTDPNLLASLNGLVGALSKSKGEVEPAVEQKPGESTEEFLKRTASDLFDEDKIGKAFPEAVMRSVGPVMGRLATQAMMANKRLLRVEEETASTYKRFSAEVEEEAQKLIKKHGPDPEIYNIAFETVKRLHAKDLSDDEVDLKVKAAVAEELKRRGIELDDEGASTMSPKRQFAQAGGGTSLPGGERKIKVRVTDALKQQALAMGIPVERLVRKMAKGA